MDMKTRIEGASEHDRRRRFVKLIGAFFCVLCMVSSTGVMLAYPVGNEQADPDGEYAAGELLVKFKDGASDNDKKDAKKAVDAKEIKEFKGLGINHWKVGADYDVEKALKEFGKKKYDDIIEFAEPNYYGYIDDIPNDPLRGEQWSMHNLGQTGGTKDADIDMMEYWNSPPDTETSTVVVAVIDTGVDYNHPDLDGVIWTNTGETPGDGIDNDGNGFVDDVHGYDFYNKDGDPMDDHGHGSHCSGVIAAERNNGVGVAGMAANAKIMAVKWLNSGGGGYVDGAISAINYAASFTKDGSKVVKITSNSWGIGQKSKALETAIKNSGALFVASAGNSASSTIQYPAGYTPDNIVSVAATDNNDALASFSNYGSTWVDLGAPGVNVYSCVYGGKYAYMSGTSMSAPHVAGAAALWLSNYPGNSIAQTKTAIMGNTDDIPALHDKTVSGGRLNVNKMFGSSSLPADTSFPQAVSTLAVDLDTETPYTLDLTWTSVGEDSLSSDAGYLYDLRYLAGDYTSGFDWAGARLATFEPVPKVAGEAESYTVTGLLPKTTYTFALKLIDEVGQAGAISNLVMDTTTPSTWDVYGPMETGTGTTYKAMALDDSGNPAVAYELGGLRFAYRTTTGWKMETVDSSGGGGMSMAWDGDTWVIAYGPGGLKFAKRNGENSWSITMLERNNVGYDCKDIATYKSGSTYKIGISYRTQNGLKYAEYKGSAWTKTTVDSAAACRYSAIKFDSAGQPAIAYCDYTGTNGNMLDIQKYAKRSSSGTWSVETVATGVVGYGVLCDLDLAKDNTPYIACSGYRSGGGWSFHFFTTKAGGGWTCMDVGDPYGSDPSIAVDDSGGTNIPYVGYTDPGKNNVYVSKGTLTNDVWSFTPEIVDPGMETNFNTILEFYTDDTDFKLGYCYGAGAGVSPAPRATGITYSERDLANPGTWG